MGFMRKMKKKKKNFNPEKWKVQALIEIKQIHKVINNKTNDTNSVGRQSNETSSSLWKLLNLKSRANFNKTHSETKLIKSQPKHKHR